MYQKLGYACNPYLPGKEHVPDGEPHIFGNRLYVFGSHDEVGADRYCAGSYVGWSAPLSDLGSWRYEGVILEKGEDPMDPDGTKDYYAPDVVQGADGRYYLYYSIEGSMVISVAVSDSPAGKYRFYGHVKDEGGHVIGSEEGDDYQFDPALLRDDDGKFYLYSGQGLPIPEVNGRIVKGAMVCELDTDMLTVKGGQRTITSDQINRFEENPFFEASSIRKIDGKYYFIYSPLPNTHFLCYAVSDHPDRNFVYGGVLVSNADIFPDDKERQEPMNYWGNNHGSMICVGEELYVFYHRNTNKSPFARQGCAERLQKTADGRLLQAELTSTGLHGGPFPAKGEYAAYIAWQLQKKDMDQFVPFQFLEYSEQDPYITETDTTEIPYITNFRDGAKAGYRYFDFDGSEQTLKVTMRGSGNGRLLVLFHQVVMAEIPVSPKDEWEIISSPIPSITGKTAICLQYEGSGAIELLSFEII